ncbi:hypothetical protein COU88_02020 [Candidatus Roizmanbacteria bacterium CG10_big_fil_rev_8_21_14_0_10_39_6]|uniref:D-alanine--D-alanine ligase n=1 Tax=Candidatus Roizmanbacteria bacterium CG10_big_fil_rev_8_21_14_0_10_39_6 TaxID=1974853 RepID=A0A2M8KST4_9BACT|nr:MAG: hypothetical protein COU88_02020 [Candidatus Roizmanbacteria bacterium CG10_big_fil_rev_8_21_14_0_10_39_6]
MKHIIVLFGGNSAEHEVSVITGLQVMESIDRKRFIPYAIYLTKEGYFMFYENLKDRKDYKNLKPKLITFGHDTKGSFFTTTSLFKRRYPVDASFLAFHGGNGESGQIQGFLDILQIPFTSPNTESSIIAMNKILTKEVVESHGIKTIQWIQVFSLDIRERLNAEIQRILKTLVLPLIIKPVHLGSSIGIGIARTEVELKEALLEASFIDTELLVEPYLESFVEYNAAVRRINNVIEVSKIERPISKDAILSFADKYQRGEGGKTDGMATLDRELPAMITKRLEAQIIALAQTIFRIIRAKGMLRIDFVLYKDNIYLTEVNPIPGSMSFYLWEASGISFKDQITDLISQSMRDAKEQENLNLKYESDIVDRFISNKHR